MEKRVIMEAKSFSLDVQDGKLSAKIDTNKDGQPVVEMDLHLTEGLQEAILRGLPTAGGKVVDMRFVGTQLHLKVDTDKDGESLLDLKIDLGEGFDEIAGAIAKK